MYFRCDKIEVTEMNWDKRWKMEMGEDCQWQNWLNRMFPLMRGLAWLLKPV